VLVPESIGTGGAVRALTDGAIQVGLASRPLSASERAAGIVEIPLARVVVGFVVDPRAHDGPLSQAELAAIYRGERARWSDGTPIVPLLREAGDSGNAAVAAALPTVHQAIEGAMAADRFPVCYTDQEMRDSLLEVEGGIGLLDVGTLHLERLALRPVPIDGVEPTAAEAAAGRYPLVKPLSLLTAGAPGGEARRFVEYARSPAVADLFEAGGFLSPAEPE
jgi:phosphate transport system substrate-binding protein